MLCMIEMFFFSSFFLLAKTINFVLFKFRFNLFSSNHLLSLTISCPIHFAKMFKSSPEQKKLVSSANNTNCNNVDVSHVIDVQNKKFSP